MDAEEAGHHIRELLGVTWRAQMDSASAYEALNTWRSAMEAKGVLVFQSSGVELEEMRGTCIPDQPLPLILLNSKDAPHGRIFSLLHEFAHILLHAGGHQTSRMAGARSPEEQPLEVAANAFAAAALLPAHSFTATAEQFHGAAQGDDDALRRLAQKVSPAHNGRRMIDCIDTSAWLDGWARDYPPDVFPSLWDKLVECVAAGVLKCSEEVYVELEKKDDGLHDWLKARKEVVVPIDVEIQSTVLDLLAAYPRLVDTHRNRSQADPSVIATTERLGKDTVVVTGEKPRGKLDTPKIPDVCDVRNLRCITFLDMLRELGWKF